MSEVDFNRVGMLLLIVKEAIPHGTAFRGIISAANAELKAIDDEALAEEEAAKQAAAEEEAANAEPQETNLESEEEVEEEAPSPKSNNGRRV